MAGALNLGQLVVRPDEPIGVSDWVDVTQAMIDAFAATTGDSQWIHNDPVRAAASPFGAPIAHGFLTLSLITRMLSTRKKSCCQPAARRISSSNDASAASKW